MERVWNAICDRCGFKKKSYELAEEWTGLMVCTECREPRHPQDFVRGVPDQFPLPWARPEGGSDTEVSVAWQNTYTTIYVDVSVINNMTSNLSYPGGVTVTGGIPSVASGYTLTTGGPFCVAGTGTCVDAGTFTGSWASIQTPSWATEGVGITVTGTQSMTEAQSMGSDGQTGIFTLTLVDGTGTSWANVSGETLTFDYAMSGTATEGTDYTAPSGSVQFTSGTTQTTVTLSPLNDTEDEATETVILTITSSSNQYADLTSYPAATTASASINLTDDGEDVSGNWLWEADSITGVSPLDWAINRNPGGGPGGSYVTVYVTYIDEGGVNTSNPSRYWGWYDNDPPWWQGPVARGPVYLQEQ